jgi:hypothetical protein
MRSKRKSILALVLLLPVGLLILLLGIACQAQDGTPPPDVLPAEPVEVLQERGILPQNVDEAGIALVKTVGIKPIHNPLTDCPTTEFVKVDPGTRVYYCYRIANTGTVDLTSHTLVDDQLGTFFSDYAITIAAGGSGIFTQTTVISTTTVNAAVWTASDAGGTTTVAAYDRAGVFVVGAQPLACGGPAVNFDQGIPAGWQVVNTPADNPVYWTNLGLSWETGNYTGGPGDAASASSRFQNGGSGIYDTELRSPVFSLNGAGAVAVHYLANYQHNANDALDLGISTNGGDSWALLQSWNSANHGILGSTPGEAVEVDLSAYSGKERVMLRWRYYNLVGPADQPDLYAQIDQVSLQCETNAAINLFKTAATDPACLNGQVTLVAPGTRLTYCYKVFNTGPNLLTLHNLVDSQQGNLLTNASFILSPFAGASAEVHQPVTILSDTVTTATWSASNPALGVAAQASDTLTITVGQPIYLPFISSLSAP